MSALVYRAEGIGSRICAALTSSVLMSLVDHLVYDAITGLTYIVHRDYV